jgi:hypothetical protein
MSKIFREGSRTDKYVGVNITHTLDKEILKGPGAKADMRKGFLINDGNREYF